MNNLIREFCRSEPVAESVVSGAPRDNCYGLGIVDGLMSFHDAGFSDAVVTTNSRVSEPFRENELEGADRL